MAIMSIRIILALFLCAATAPSWAQATKMAGDPAAGKAKAAVCSACHGADGNSTNPEWPKIAGQHAAYIAKQITEIKAGKVRKSDLMVGMVAALSAQDIEDLAAHFASQSMSGGFTDKDLTKLGKRIYRGGNAESGVPACMMCHGPQGAGDPMAGFPSLAGQHAKYVQMQLDAFREGTRSNDAKRMMRDIALKMTPDEMKAVASYINGLH
ncbi:MAG: cytochrome c553 [Gammaproteobacteria bacterium]|jgi:cytochrome c553